MKPTLAYLAGLICALALVGCPKPLDPGQGYYKVVYDPNGATSGSAPVDERSYRLHDGLTILGNSGNLARDGLAFIGWNVAADGSGYRFLIGEPFEMVREGVILYATWSAAPCHRVRYDWLLGGPVELDPNNYPEGSGIRVGYLAGTKANPGSALAGWMTDSEGRGRSYAPYASIAMGGGDISLYAVWIPDVFTFSNSYDGQDIWLDTWSPPSDNVALAIPAGVTRISGVTNIFNGTHITSLILPASLSSIPFNAFGGCHELSQVTFSAGLVTIGEQAFMACRSLVRIELPSTVAAIDFSAFKACSNLAEVFVEAAVPPALVANSGAFDGASDALRIHVPDGSLEDYRMADGWKDYESRLVSP